VSRTTNHLCLAVLAAGALLGACRSTPPVPLPPPPLQPPVDLDVREESFVGSALAGREEAGSSALEALTDAPGEDFRVVTARILYLRSSVLGLTEELAGAAEGDSLFAPLIQGFDLALSLGERPGVIASPRLFEGARITTGVHATTWFEALATRPAAESLWLAERTAPVGPGLTLALDVRTALEVKDNDNFLGEFPARPRIPMGLRVAVDAGRRPGTTGPDPNADATDVRWTLTLRGALPSEARARTVPSDARFRPGSPAPAVQLIRPTLRPGPGTSVLALLPAPFPGEDSEATGRTLAVLLTLEPEPAGERLQELRDELMTARTKVSGAPTQTRGEIEQARYEALERLRLLLVTDADVRPALLFLAMLLDAPLARDALLQLHEAELRVLTQWLLVDTVLHGRSARWALEQHAWRAVTAGVRGERIAPPTEAGELLQPKSARENTARLAGAGPRDFGVTAKPKESVVTAAAPLERSASALAALEGILLRHAGEPARYPRLVDTLLGVSVDTADLEARLVAENRAFLEDSRPAARVRAFDWLAARERTPDGYDPLSSAKARRAALAARTENRASSDESLGDPEQ